MTIPDRVIVSSAITMEHAAAIVSWLESEIAKVIVGQHALVRRMLTGLFAAIPFATARSEARTGCGHILLEGVPGVAKSLTATTLAHAMSARFQRIQLTPDLLPADILGTRIYDAKTATFRLEDPFWVLATQNPVEQEGVYPLPEAQLDRFSMMVRVGYPSATEEMAMLHARMTEQHIVPRVSPSDVTRLRAFIRDAVYVDDKIMEYIVRLGRATRAPDEAGRGDLRELLTLGVSPRSYQHVLALTRVTAFLHGRAYVLPEDVKEIYCDASRHRIARTVRAQAENIDADQILGELLHAVPIP